MSSARADDGLVAALAALELRRERRLWTRRLAGGSVLAWMQALRAWLPALIGWMSAMALVGCAALVAALALLEYRCARRGRRADEAGLRIGIHEERHQAIEVGAALWSTLGALALMPCTAILLDLRIPAALLREGASGAVALAAGVLFAELVALPWFESRPRD